MRWDLTIRTFACTWPAEPAITAPTEIGVPSLHYPDG